MAMSCQWSIASCLKDSMTTHLSSMDSRRCYSSMRYWRKLIRWSTELIANTLSFARYSLMARPEMHCGSDTHWIDFSTSIGQKRELEISMLSKARTTESCIIFKTAILFATEEIFPGPWFGLVIVWTGKLAGQAW
jgi:hypothetical protein